MSFASILWVMGYCCFASGCNLLAACCTKAWHAACAWFSFWCWLAGVAVTCTRAGAVVSAAWLYTFNVLYTPVWLPRAWRANGRRVLSIQQVADSFNATILAQTAAWLLNMAKYNVAAPRGGSPSSCPASRPRRVGGAAAASTRVRPASAPPAAAPVFASTSVGTTSALSLRRTRSASAGGGAIDTGSAVVASRAPVPTAAVAAAAAINTTLRRSSSVGALSSLLVNVSTTSPSAVVAASASASAPSSPVAAAAVAAAVAAVMPLRLPRSTSAPGAALSCTTDNNGNSSNVGAIYLRSISGPGSLTNTNRLTRRTRSSSSSSIDPNAQGTPGYVGTVVETIEPQPPRTTNAATTAAATSNDTAATGNVHEDWVARVTPLVVPSSDAEVLGGGEVVAAAAAAEFVCGAAVVSRSGRGKRSLLLGVLAATAGVAKHLMHAPTRIL